MEKTKKEEENQRGAENRRRCMKTRLSLAVSASIIVLVVGVLTFGYGPGDKALWPFWGAPHAKMGQPKGTPAGGDQTLPYFVAYPGNYSFLVDEPGTCRLRNPFAVLMVKVHPRNRADRDAIRATWGKWNQAEVRNKTLSLFFLLGLPTGDEAHQVQLDVLEESAKHGDILQADFVDSYFNLTVKTMVGFEWLTRCANYSYAVSLDSDMFLNVPNLVDLMLEAPAVNYQTGHVFSNTGPFRDPNSKWYLPYEVYPESHFPRYASGRAYVLSSDLPRKLVAASRHVKVNHIDDVYVGLCMDYLDISPSDPPTPGSFEWRNDVPYSRCAYSKLISTQCGRNNNNRVNNWADFKRPGPHCME